MASKSMKNKFGMLDRKRVVKDALVVKEDPVTAVVNSIESKFDYDSLNISIEDKEDLKNYEREVLYQKGRMIESALITGEYLEKARELFNRYGEENNSYMEWYQALGFSKDQVYLLRGRYRLSLEHPSHKTIIADLSGKEVKELINKKVEKEQVERVLSSGIRTAPEIKKAISTAAEIGSDVMDAEIVETEKDKMLKKLSEIDSKINRLEEELRELKSYRAKLQEEIKGL
jgi:hypothetical protein|uniref:Uncharacterized protein n=1 Tax=Myoviridae sp. ctZ2t4 TaxID=2827693 RepID=A0A8S5SS49_9CAUD|nr:MAG TPA: hypothetical protein [Myoviridae sp. ctZ2t4]